MTLDRLKRLLGEATGGPWLHRDLSMTGESLLQLSDKAEPRPNDRSIQLATTDVHLICALRNCGPALVAVAEAVAVWVPDEYISHAELAEREQAVIDAHRALETALEAR